ncbi:hypothetical protein Landi51_12865 [Colletotrichum acutatum]
MSGKAPLCPMLPKVSYIKQKTSYMLRIAPAHRYEQCCTGKPAQRYGGRASSVRLAHRQIPIGVRLTVYVRLDVLIIPDRPDFLEPYAIRASLEVSPHHGTLPVVAENWQEMKKEVNSAGGGAVQCRCEDFVAPVCPTWKVGRFSHLPCEAISIM